MIRTSDGPVNLAGAHLHRTTYERPVDVTAGFEQMACGRSGHTRGRHDTPKSDADQRVCYRRLGSIQVQVTRDDNQLSEIVNAGVLQDLVQLCKA
jgi:hypothetical protein